MSLTVEELDKSYHYSTADRAMGYVRLLRPANLVTSGADVLAGWVIVGSPAGQLLWRLLASIGLYAGGIVLNDYFDRTLDATERPERPIPRGVVSAERVAALGGVFLIVAIGAGFRASLLTGIIASVIALLVLAYDGGMKNRAIGPILMGSCRGLNLLLGLAAAPALFPHLWFLPLLPFAYIIGVTLLSRGEVTGGNRNAVALAMTLFSSVVLALVIIFLSPALHFLAALPFVVLFIMRVGIPLWRAYCLPQAILIRNAVHAAVVSLIVLDAALAAGYVGVLYGAAILSLSVLAGELGKLFPVT